MKTVLIVNSSMEYEQMFNELGFTIVHALSPNVDLVCFTGGEDVTPQMYGDKPHRLTHYNFLRDRYEEDIFLQTLALGIPMVGICRGGQFLNVMSGGRMYQHVTSHTRSHYITDVYSGDVVYVSSTHHQMMMPSSEAVLVASSTLGGDREWYEGEVFKHDISDKDIEVVFYEKTRCLCFQPHPEFDSAEFMGMRNYFESLLNRYFFPAKDEPTYVHGQVLPNQQSLTV